MDRTGLSQADIASRLDALIITRGGEGSDIYAGGEHYRIPAVKAENIVAIAGIDTRKLTRILREKGAQSGAILVGTQGNEPSEAQALDLARSFPGLSGMDLAKVVSATKPYPWTEGEWVLGKEIDHEYCLAELKGWAPGAEDPLRANICIA